MLSVRPGMARIALILGATMNLAVLIVFLGTVLHSAGASTALPKVVVSPNGDLRDGESITVSVGPNSFFTPHSRIVIIECADPGGTAAHLPTDVTTCDGNTIQGNSILVAADGSFSESGYTLYQLPNVVLGEQSNGQPVCNDSNTCVLFVGQDQNDFTSPKLFSAPFTIGAAAGASASGATSTTSPTGSTSSATPSTAGVNASSSSPSPGSSSPSVNPSTVATLPTASANGSPGSGASQDPTVAAGTLPNTGISAAALLWLLSVGTALMLSGSLGRYLAARVQS